MYIVAIAWIYVVLMMSIAETGIVAGVMTFLFYGLLPPALFLWIVGTPERRRRSARKTLHDGVGTDDREDSQRDQ